MTAMTSRCWAVALYLLILWPSATALAADEFDEQPEAVSTGGSRLQISTTEAVDEPAAIEPQDEEPTELDGMADEDATDDTATEDEPGALLEQDDADADDMPADGDEQPDRVITPRPGGQEDGDEPSAKRKTSRRKTSGTRLMPARRKAKLEVMSFRTMRPGTSSKEELIREWGAPAEVRKVHGVVTYNYQPEGGARTSVTLTDGLVTAIVVQIEPALAPEELATKLTVTGLSSVQVADDDGQILGEAFPERGLLFGYASGSSEGVRVSQIVLEAPEPQPFLLRAEAELDTDYARCLADANAALELDPKLAAAQAMRSRVFRQAGDMGAALQAAEAAVALEPHEPEWHLVLAKVLVQLSDFERAKEEIQTVLDGATADALARAGAHLLLGDTLALASSRGYGPAVKEHQEAIRLAKTLIEDQRARRRRKACELLIDAQLHVAYSIAWGHFQHKADAVQKWLDGAQSLAEDLAAKNILRPDVVLRVNEQALAALAGLSDPPDATKFENASLSQAKALYEETSDPIRASQIQWQLGLALCDAVQVEQTRHNYDRALEVGKLAYEHLKRADEAGRQLPDHDFLLGQLFYRLGAIHAVGREDHKQALVWYGRAVKLLEAPVPASCATDSGRHGETFISMAVSYWETGQQEEAVRLTRQGVSLMEQAVRDGLMAKSALAIPYGNLASMYHELGDPQQAKEFSKLAAKIQTQKQ